MDECFSYSYTLIWLSSDCYNDTSAHINTRVPPWDFRSYYRTPPTFMVSTLTMCHHANGRQHYHDGISTIRHYHCHGINIIIIVASSRQHYHNDIFTVQPSCYHYYNDSSTITTISSLSSSSWHQRYHVITIIILTIMSALSSHWVLVEVVAAYTQPVACILLLLVVSCCTAIHVCTYSYTGMYTPTWVYLSKFTSWAKGVFLANRNRTSDRWMTEQAEAYDYTTVHRSTNWAIAR